MSYFDQKSKSRFSLDLNNNSLIMLMSVIMVVFVLFAMVQVIYYFSYPKEMVQERFYNDIYVNVALPAELKVLIRKPWTLITHMFFHAPNNIWHLIGNLIWLWFFGYILHDMTGNTKIIPVFIYGALGGALTFLLAYNLIPTMHSEIMGTNAVGSSAGVMAIAIATTMIAPGYRIFPFINGGIPLWVLTLIFVVIDLASIPVSNHGGHIAHLGGALAGFLFIYFYRRGHDGSAWMNNFYEWISNLFNPDKPSRGRTIRSELFYKSKSEPFTKTPNLTQQRVDEILDKISQKGYDSLSGEEKELLKRASKEDL